MSSFIRAYKNPITGKVQKCFCLDNMFGGRNYGYGFPKDGSDADIDFKGDLKELCDFYKEEDLID